MMNDENTIADEEEVDDHRMTIIEMDENTIADEEEDDNSRNG
jgi:hypothetical protein